MTKKSQKKTSPRFLGSSLTGDVIIYQAAVVVVSTIILVSLGYLILSYRADREYTLKSKEYIAFLQQSLAIPLWTFDEEGIKIICKAFIQNDFIAALEVVNDKNEVLFSYYNEEEKDNIQQRAMITHGGEAIGVPLTRAVVQLEVDGVLDLVEGLQLLQGVDELLLAPGVVDAGGDAHASRLQVGLVAPDGQAGVKGAQAVEMATIAALVDD